MGRMPCFSQAVPSLLLPPPMLVDSQSSIATVYSQDDWDDAYADGSDGDDEDEKFESYLDAWNFEIDESVRTAQPLAANQVIPTYGNFQCYSSARKCSSWGTILGTSLPAQVKFSGKPTCSEEVAKTILQTVPSKNIDCGSNRSPVSKRPFTLGELILMSRRRSYYSKSVLRRDQNLYMAILTTRPSSPFFTI